MDNIGYKIVVVAETKMKIGRVIDRSNLEKTKKGELE